MKTINCKLKQHFAIQDSKNVKNKTNRIKKIFDAKYEEENMIDGILKKIIPALSIN